MTTYEWIMTFAPIVTGFIGWLAGTRIRRNDTIKALQTTIDLLIAKNKELYDEIVRLRQENDALKDEGIKRDNKISKLELQLERMKK